MSSSAAMLGELKRDQRRVDETSFFADVDAAIKKKIDIKILEEKYRLARMHSMLAELEQLKPVDFNEAIEVPTEQSKNCSQLAKSIFILTLLSADALSVMLPASIGLAELFGVSFAWFLPLGATDGVFLYTIMGPLLKSAIGMETNSELEELPSVYEAQLHTVTRINQLLTNPLFYNNIEDDKYQAYVARATALNTHISSLELEKKEETWDRILICNLLTLANLAAHFSKDYFTLVAAVHYFSPLLIIAPVSPIGLVIIGLVCLLMLGRYLYKGESLRRALNSDIEKHNEVKTELDHFKKSNSNHALSIIAKDRNQAAFFQRNKETQQPIALPSPALQSP